MDLAPLIDVVFQLLVFFMLTSTFANPAIKLNLPKAVTNDQLNEQQLTLSIDQEGQMYINDILTSKEFLQEEISNWLIKLKTSAINVKGDAEMPYKVFVEVMDTARKAGAKQINILHQKATQ